MDCARIKNKEDRFLCLTKKTVSDVNFKPNGYKDTKISLRFDGKKHSNKVIIKELKGYVGGWIHPKDKHVFMDNDMIKPHEMVLVAVHETVEKYVEGHYKMDDEDAHFIATIAERDYAKKKHIDWYPYEVRVKLVHERGI